MKLIQENDIVFDTETTGLGTKDQIIQIAIINARGTTLLDTLVSTDRPISPGARHVHGIGKAELRHAPGWEIIYPVVQEIFNLTRALGGEIWAYNAQFDARMLIQTCHAHRLPEPKVIFQCAMWQAVGSMRKLTEVCPVEVNAPAHSAIGDCLRTLYVLGGGQ